MEKLRGLDLEGKLVLDAGTGACGMTKLLEKRDAKVISIDLEREYLRDCRSQTESAQFLEADLSDLGFIKNGTFDHVICNFLISALSENRDLLISSVLREFYRVLKYKGSLVIIDYYPFEEGKNPGDLDELQVQLWRSENALFELLGEGHLEEISPMVLDRELEAIGFQSSEIKTLTEEVPWPTDLLKEHEQMIRKNIEKLDEVHMKDSFTRRLKDLMESAEGKKVYSGAIYELRAKK
ncbi:MAG: class I SAM-dependent methyltransferase [Candidatus Natronoplasma sp.]